MNQKNRYLKILGAFLGVLVLIISLFSFLNSKSEVKPNLFIGNHSFYVEFAQSEVERSRGLSNRNDLNHDAGMLFIFERPSKQSFWMKDMKFSIDIVWIDENKKIVGFVEDAKPEDYPKIYSSPDRVLYVLEIQAGEVKKRNFMVGDSVFFDLSID